MNPAETALETLRLVVQVLGGNPSPATKENALTLAELTLQTLEQSGRKRLTTEALAARVQHLERQLADRDPGERRTIICGRLGISRSRYFELRSPNVSGPSRV